MVEASAPRLPSSVIDVLPSKVFTHPTRLADSWTPDILEIHLPGSRASRAEIEIVQQEGSTRSLAIPERNPLRRLYRRMAAPVLLRGQPVFDSRYEADGNIAHVLDSIVVPVLGAREAYPGLTVILRAKATAMARAACALFRIPVLCTDREVEGKVVSLKVPGNAPFHGDGFYSSYFGGISFDGYVPGTPERVFIARKGTRRLLNEEEVEGILKVHGFRKLYFEDIPLAEQWSVARNAKAIVGLHGAALYSLAFNRNSVRVLELFHPGYFVNLYRRMTYGVGGSWCGVTGQLPPDIIKHLDYLGKGRHFALQPTKIHPEALRRALAELGIA